jgi:hypothetical protein
VPQQRQEPHYFRFRAQTKDVANPMPSTITLAGSGIGTVSIVALKISPPGPPWSEELM